MKTSPLALASILVVVVACRGGDENPCNEAAAICGAGQRVDSAQCTGEPKSYAECIVAAGNCSPQTAADCARPGTAIDGSRTNAEARIALAILSFQIDGGTLTVSFEVENQGESTPVRLLRGLFMVEDVTRNLYGASGGTCQGVEALAAGGKQRCELQYSVPSNFKPRRLVYQDELQRQATADFPGSDCATGAGAENTLAACGDGCSNDGDRFVDCDDFDCCDVRQDCPASSSCGQRGSCREGPENTRETCSDGCSNDGDRFVDCDDYDCCAVRPDCPAASACGRR